MQANAAEMIWRGRTHLGDEPGIYGDASYGGLAIELPVTLREYRAGTGAVDVTFDLTAEGVRSFGPPYPGHTITVFALTQVPHSNPPVWQRATLGESILEKDTASVTARIKPGARFVSVRVEADVTVTPAAMTISC